MKKVVIDPGHGGRDSGAEYKGRLEKDDVLAMALAVGEILERNGVNVQYTRLTDVYNSPFEKAMMGNNAGADLFVSLHRDSSENSNTYNGVSALLYNDRGEKAVIARDILSGLENIGFRNIGVVERPNLVVLKRTRMPAILLELGFINSDVDNKLFDENFDEMARVIADGILDTINDDKETTTYSVEVMNIESLEKAVEMEKMFKRQGIDAVVRKNK